MEQWAAQYLLEHSDPNSVFEWLKQNPAKPGDLLSESREEFENTLLERKDPVINLGLALFGSDPIVGAKLYQTGDETIKKAVVSGASVSPGFLSEGWVPDLLPEMLENWNTEVLSTLFSNKYLPDDVLTDLFERKTPFDSLEEREWMLLCVYTSRNDRLSTPYDSSWIDGFDEYQYKRVFTSAWWLFEKFPQTPRAANVLVTLAEKLVIEAPHDMDIMQVIDKWNIDDDKNADLFELARSLLANLIPNYDNEFHDLKDSQDIALRKAYYRNLSYPKPIDIESGFEKDGEAFIDAALYNKNIFAQHETREALKKVCWSAPDKHHQMDLPNYFNARCDYWMSQHPEWFKDDWSGELPFEEIEDKEKRLEKRVEHLNLQVNDIHKSLLGKNDDEYPGEDKQTSTIEYIKSELEAITQLLIKMHSKSSTAWNWGIAGITIGYIFAKF